MVKKVNSKLKFLKQDVCIDENKLIIDFSINTSKDYPWGILIKKKVNSLEIKSKNDNLVKIFNEESFIGDNFAFLYLHLIAGINNIKIIIKF